MAILARSRSLPFLAALLALTVVGVGAAAAAAPTISEFPIPTAQAAPGGIAAGPDGDLWFSELQGNKIGRITTAGTVVNEFVVNSALETLFPTGVAAGPDGNMWFAVYSNNQVGRLTTTGTVKLFTLPSTNSGPADIVAGPDGNLWFTELQGNRIGRITPAGTVTEFTIPTSNAEPTGITTGPDGAVWFSETGAGRIGRVTTAGSITEFVLPDALSTPEPTKIVAGPDGNLWFTELQADKIGRVTPSGTFTEFTVPTNAAEPIVIASGPDGNLWFTEFHSGRVASITTAGQITEYVVPTSQSGPAGIAAGPDGNMWFTESEGNKIGRINLGGSGPCVASATTMCIDDQAGDKRWQITSTFATAQSGGSSGNGQSIPLSSVGVTEGGLFWFFTADNPEMLIKVINACAVNQHFWLFYSATTNVGFTVIVRDTKTSRTMTYRNTDGTAAAPVQDTSAFTCTAQGDVGDGDDNASAGRDMSSATVGNVATVEPETVADIVVPDATTCTTNATSLCIDGHFQITASFKTAEGGGSSGNGHAIALGSLGVTEGGLFWFFQATNPEMLVKVIDACALNNKYWVFYAAGTNVGFTVNVTDLATGNHKSYTNKDGVAAAPVQDTSALACPK